MSDEDGSGPLLAAARAFLERPGGTRLLVGGTWQDAQSGATFETCDPATGAPLCSVAQAGPADVDAAVLAARAAFVEPHWRGLEPAAREQMLRRVADLIEEHAEELAVLDVLDNGMPLTLARGQVAAAAETFRYYAGWPTKLEGTLLPSGPDHHRYVRREPIGVCALITPWNFPLAMVAWKVAPALAAGNVAVLKPAEQTPLSAVRFCELAGESGLPPGVLSLLTGDHVAGEALVLHSGVDKIAFTGSTEVGVRILSAAAGAVRPVSLELGGKCPNIILADADLDAAVPAALNAIFVNSGQICTAASRLLLERSIHDEFLDRLVVHVRDLRIGSGLDPGTTMGPVISAAQLDRVAGYVSVGAAAGASLVAGGHRVDRPGWFFEPTVFAGVTNDMAVAQEEIFGPVLSVVAFDDVSEAVAVANHSEYGLAAAVWTRDVSRAHRVASQLEAGTVFVNCYHESGGGAPFGGYKRSGLGREQGRAGIELYTQEKAVHVRI